MSVVRAVRLAVAASVCLALATLTGCVAMPVTPSSAERTGTSATAGSAGTLTIAIAGMVTPKEGLAYYEDLSKYLARKVGREARLIHKADYAECNEMLAAKKVDVAFVCSGPYAAGHDAFGLELLGAPVVAGTTTYRSYIIVPRSSAATSLASLRGVTFAFTDPLSNSGRNVPAYMLLGMGTTPDRFFGRWFYTYSHDNSIKAVSAGKADGAAVDSLIYEYNAATKPSVTAGTRVLQRSEPYAIPPVVVRPGLDPALKERLRAALLNLHVDPQGREILRKMRIERFVAITDAAYDPVRVMLRETEASGAATP